MRTAISTLPHATNPARQAASSTLRDQARALFEIWLVGRRPTNDLRSAIFFPRQVTLQATGEELGVAFEPLERQIRGAAEREHRGDEGRELHVVG